MVSRVSCWVNLSEALSFYLLLSLEECGIEERELKYRVAYLAKGETSDNAEVPEIHCGFQEEGNLNE